MMRIIWHTLCLFLATVTGVQADTYRDSNNRDNGFGPMNMMQGIPNPMGMFDSSERRRDERRYRPPPPPPAPGYPYGFGRAPAYAPPPPAGLSPYGYPNQPASAPIQHQAAPSNRPAPNAPATPNRASSQPAEEKPSMLQDEQKSFADYSFRPMTPMQPDVESVAPTAGSTSSATPTSNWQEAVEPPPPPSPDTATSGSRSLPPATQASDEVMLNGKPAVFRPMNLGVETSPP